MTTVKSDFFLFNLSSIFFIKSSSLQSVWLMRCFYTIVTEQTWFDERPSEVFVIEREDSHNLDRLSMLVGEVEGVNRVDNFFKL